MAETPEFWILERWVERFESALQGMTGGAYRVEPAPAAAPSGADDLVLTQGFSAADGGAVRITVPAAFWQAVGHAVLQAAGIEEAAELEYRNTFQEVADQAGGGLAQDLTARLGREIEKRSAPEQTEEWLPAASYRIPTLGAESLAFQLSASKALAQCLVEPEEKPELQAAVAAAGAGGASQTVTGKTLDLLLEVELPVSVSFGRSQMRLKDLVKLSTGSIVELNRTVTEPVEVIINNCVIARGEVVVVEGNYGVRIRQIVSRQERLRTLF
jgi:flagellar motor switch protein FliN/FliY